MPASLFMENQTPQLECAQKNSKANLSRPRRFRRTGGFGKSVKARGRNPRVFLRKRRRLAFRAMYRAAGFEGRNRTFEGKRFDIWIYPASCGTRLRGGPTCKAADIIFPAKSCFSLKHSILQIAGPDGDFPPQTNPENSNPPAASMLWRLSAIPQTF